MSPKIAANEVVSHDRPLEFPPADGVLLFEDPATTSKIPVLERPVPARSTCGNRMELSQWAA